MNEYMALLMARQNERELAVSLERRRLLIEAKGADPRFRRGPGVWHRIQALFHRGAPEPAAPLSQAAALCQAAARPASAAPGSAVRSNA